jgi:hypothetical protein
MAAPLWKRDSLHPSVTRTDIAAVLGPVDELIIAEIIGMGATCEELAEAEAWVTNDEPLMNRGQPLAGGRVSRLVEIIAALEEEAELEKPDR